MKVTVDLDKLLDEGKITQAEHDKFSQFAARDTAHLAINILVGFGVIAVGGALLALLPSAMTAVVLGLIISVIGLALLYARIEQWQVLANICILVGALLFGGGVIKEGEGSIEAFLLVAAAFGGASIFARSALMAVLAVLALSSCLGVRTGYLHAAYFLGVQEPAWTVALFSVFSLATYQLSKRLPLDFQGITIAASRTGVFLVNFGFWIGSLWGDHAVNGGLVLNHWIFTILWAIVLIVAGGWAWKQNRRWLLNVVAVFAAIHFYTQWFEWLGATAESVLIAGLIALGFAIGLRTLNTSLGKEA